VSPSRPFGAFGDSNGSPAPSSGHMKRAKLFVVNPSDTPWDSPAAPDGKSENIGYLKHPRATVSTDASQAVPSGSKDIEVNEASHAVIQSAMATPSQVPLRPHANHVTSTTPPRVNASKSEQDSPAKNKKRTLLGRSKKSLNQSRGRPAISQPILANIEAVSTPFARIKTIDLASAAASERERREGIGNRELVASRPAPRPPMPEPSVGLKKSISIRRKEMPNGTQIAKPPLASSQSFSNSGLSVDMSASSTSTLLSPGHEEVRRRSPRTSKSFEQDIEKSGVLESTVRRNTSRLLTSARQQPPNSNAVSQQTVMYVNNIVYDNPGVVRSIISGAPTIFARSKEKQESSQYRSPVSPTPSSGSIIHRPRPYRRDSEKDRVLFPSEPSPRHRRSRSGSSTTSRRRILQSHPSSPTDLPALPPPTSASRLRKLLPNDTRSMTVDEKISLLFPAPPGILPLHIRRSSVPSLPRIPSGLLHTDFLNKDFTEQEPQSQRTSRRSTISLCERTPHDSNSPFTNGKPLDKELDTYRFSMNTYRTLAGAPRDSWIPGSNANILVEENADLDEARSIKLTEKRKLAPSATEVASDVDGSRDDSTTPWASLHPPSLPIDLAATRQVAQETYMQIRKNRELPDLPINANSERRSKELNDRSTQFLPSLELGTSASLTRNQSLFLNSSPGFRESHPSTLQSSQPWHRRIGDEPLTFSKRRKNLRSRAMPPPTPLLLSSSSRHTAAAREPNPNPIDSPGKAIEEIQAQLKRFDESLDSLFRGTTNNHSSNTFDAVAGDRGELLEDLEKEMGLQEIHWMRLQHNFDRDSNSIIVSPDTRLQAPSPPSSEASSRRTSRSITRRLRIGSSNTPQSQRDGSTSTSSTQSSANSRASIWQRRLAEAQMEYMENAPPLLGKHNINFLTLAKAQLGSPTPPDSIDSASESDSDFENDARSDVYTSESGGDSKPPVIQALWAPRPSVPKVIVGLLWNPVQCSHTVGPVSPEPAAKSLRPAPRRDLLPLSIVSTKLWSKPEPLRVRPCVGLWGSRMTRPKNIVTRAKTQKPLRKPKRMNFLPDIGKSHFDGIVEVANKYTVESPSPLPNKHGTLGIFQFPWGEKSDCPMFDPIPVPTVASARASTILNSGLDARSRQLEPEILEYPSSFFDDYGLDPEQSSDDDFDETTLWEIASLLNSADIPSRQSLLPSPEIIEDYSDVDDETSNGTRSPAQPTQRPPTTKFIPIQSLKPTSPISPPPRANSMADISQIGSIQTAKSVPQWLQAYILHPNYVETTGSSDTTSLPSINATNTQGALEPNNEGEHIHLLSARTTAPAEGRVVLWAPTTPDQEPPVISWLIGAQDLELVKHTDGCSASKSRQAGTSPLKISSSNLWNKPIRVVSSRASDERSGLWYPSRNEELTVRSAAGGKASRTLWAPRERRPVIESAGLFTAEIHRTDFRTSDKPLDALETIRRPHLATTTLPPLNSQSLWSPQNELFVDRHRISESSVRPSSSSVYSVSSRSLSPTSGRSSPDSDDRSATSASSKVSSIWTPLASLAKEVAKVPWGSARIQRPSATPAEWDAALTQVLSQSPSHTSLRVIEASSYDPAVLHPVFFTDLLVSSASSIHPAANGYVSYPRSLHEQENKKRLWAKPVCSSAAPIKAPLWAAHRAAKTDSPPTSTYYAPPMVRKPHAESSDSLLELSSDTLWQPNTPSPSEKHWLHTTSIKTKPASKLQTQTSERISSVPIKEPPQSLVWMPATDTANPTSPTRSRTLWTPAATEGSIGSKARTQSIFANPHTLPRTRPASSRPSTTVGKSTGTVEGELWRPKWNLPENPKDWLKNRQASRVEFRY
jgi:hypothetical protein